MILSDHGSKFVGANHEIRELMFLDKQKIQKNISEFCFAQHIE